MNDEQARKLRDADIPEKQPIWRTFSASHNCGYFVWSVHLVMGKPHDEKYFEKCRDGSFIMIECHHFWSLEQSAEFLTDTLSDEWQTVTLIQ
jgi:hypothetical protein